VKATAEVLGRRRLGWLALLGTLSSSPAGSSPHGVSVASSAVCPASAPFASLPTVAPPLSLPAAMLASLRERLDEVRGATFAGWRTDLNDDGVADWVVWALGSACGGTGNCVAALADGRDGRLLGAFVASALVVAPQRHGWPVVQAYAALGGEDVARRTWTLEREEYREGSLRRMKRATYAAEIRRYCSLRR
jgi:hypothetical protein